MYVKAHCKVQRPAHMSKSKTSPMNPHPKPASPQAFPISAIDTIIQLIQAKNLGVIYFPSLFFCIFHI